MIIGNARRALKILVLAAAAAGGISLFATLNAHSNAIESEADSRSDIIRDDADYRIIWTCRYAPSESACVSDARKVARDSERSEQELAAQKVSAWWTKVMGIAAVIGMVLSAVGVWLVKTTFDETRRANIIAIAQSSHEIGPKIKVEKVRVRVRRNYVFVTLVVRNSGDGEAISVRAGGRYRAWPDVEGRVRWPAKWRKISPEATYLAREIPPGAFEDVAATWGSYRKWGAAQSAWVMDCFANGDKPGMEFEIDILWDTQFYSGFKGHIRFQIKEMTFAEHGGDRYCYAELTEGLKYIPRRLG